MIFRKYQFLIFYFVKYIKFYSRGFWKINHAESKWINLHAFLKNDIFTKLYENNILHFWTSNLQPKKWTSNGLPSVQFPWIFIYGIYIWLNCTNNIVIGTSNQLVETSYSAASKWIKFYAFFWKNNFQKTVYSKWT